MHPFPNNSKLILSSCHPHCPNHYYNAFRPTPLHTYSPPQSPKQLLVAIGVPPNTPLLEIASTMTTTSSTTTIPITNYAHSNALTAHPLLPLILNSTSPNCCVQPLLIPDPHRHLRFFLVSLTMIPHTRRTALSIRPPPQPPPPPEPPPPSNITSRSSSS